MSRTSFQADPAIARLSRELQADVRKLEARVSALESRATKLENWIAVDLRTWLEDLATAAAFADAFPEPPI